MTATAPRPLKPRKRGYLWPAAGDGRWIPIGRRERFWSKQGSVHINDLGQFDMTAEIARHMTTHHLHYYPHIRTGDRPGHAIVEAELRRREGWVARTALAISALALVVAFGTLLLRVFGR